MAHRGWGALRGVQRLSPLAESLHLGSGDDQLSDALVEVPSMAVEQVDEVLTASTALSRTAMTSRT